MRIVTVLKTGGDFTPDHVWALFYELGRHAPQADFICLSDDGTVPGHRPLQHGWPGWWSKIEAFKIPGPALYLDLDSVVVNSLGPLLEAVRHHEFIVMRDSPPNTRKVWSAVMGWSTSQRRIYDLFVQDPARHMKENRTPDYWGDQGFIERHFDGCHYWRDLCPGALVSWKRHCQDGIPSGARVVVFHGKPRPWQTDIRRLFTAESIGRD